MKAEYVFEISYMEYGERLYRKLLVSPNCTLSDLGLSILSIFNTLGCSFFYFTIQEKKYVCEHMRLTFGSKKDDGMAKDIKLMDLTLGKEHWDFYYGYNYEHHFTITFKGEEMTSGKKRIPRVIKGAGYGIVEGNPKALDDLLNRKGFSCRFKPILDMDFSSFDIDLANQNLAKDMSLLRNRYNPYIRK